MRRKLEQIELTTKVADFPAGKRFYIDRTIGTGLYTLPTDEAESIFLYWNEVKFVDPFGVDKEDGQGAFTLPA